MITSLCGFSYFGCLWIFCNDGLLKKKRTDIESGSGFLRDWWLHLRERQRIFLSLSISHYLYHFLYLQRSLAFSLSHRVSSGIGGCATEKVKISTSLFSLSFRHSHFLLFFSFFLSYSLSHRGWIWVPEGLELGPERACFPLSLYFWRPAFATLFIPCTLIRGNSPADCDAEKN